MRCPLGIYRLSRLWGGGNSWSRTWRARGSGAAQVLQGVPWGKERSGGTSHFLRDGAGPAGAVVPSGGSTGKSGGGRPEESTQAEAGFMPHGFSEQLPDPFLISKRIRPSSPLKALSNTG